MVSTKLLLLSVVDLVDSHAVLVWPPSRAAGSADFKTAGEYKKGCRGMSCNYSSGKGQEAIAKHNKQTTSIWDVDEKMASGFKFMPRASAEKIAWSAPGSSRVLHTCGKEMRDVKRRTTLDFPEKLRVKWTAGSTQKVAWTAMHGHEGGYAFRLLKVPKNPKAVSETAFQKNTLEFVSNKTTVRTTDGREFEIPTRRAFFEVNGIRQQWSMNPIPENPTPTRTGSRFPLPNGIKYPRDFYNDDKHVASWKPYWNWKFSLIDEVKIPELEPGHYYINWRWDAGNAPQNFCNCGDVEIVADEKDATPFPAPGEDPKEMDPANSGLPDGEDADDLSEPEAEPEEEEEEEEEEKKNRRRSRKKPCCKNKSQKNCRRCPRPRLMQEGPAQPVLKAGNLVTVDGLEDSKAYAEVHSHGSIDISEE